MSDGFSERKKANEEGFFARQNSELLKRLAERRAAAAETSEKITRKSPITGEALIEREIAGVIVDVCPTSGGIWLDPGELEQIIEKSSKDSNWLGSFFGFLNKK